MPEATTWPFGTDAIPDDPLTALRITGPRIPNHRVNEEQEATE
jgi:hypothetical protein